MMEILDRLSKVQKTAESLLATVSGSGDYTNKLVYTDLDRLKGFIRQNPGVREGGRGSFWVDLRHVQVSPGFSLDDESAVEIRFIVKCGDEETRKKILADLKLTSDAK
eukprot:751602-Hanusia_phi.AAC.1